MKKVWEIIVFVLVVGHFCLSAAALGSPNITGTISTKEAHRSTFPDLAKISPVDAVKAALSAKNGKLLKLALQNEKGFLVYSIELVSPGKEIVEILVDAGSGNVLSIERE